MLTNGHYDKESTNPWHPKRPAPYVYNHLDLRLRSQIPSLLAEERQKQLQYRRERKILNQPPIATLQGHQRPTRRLIMATNQGPPPPTSANDKKLETVRNGSWGWRVNVTLHCAWWHIWKGWRALLHSLKFNYGCGHILRHYRKVHKSSLLGILLPIWRIQRLYLHSICRRYHLGICGYYIFKYSGCVVEKFNCKFVEANAAPCRMMNFGN